MRHDTRALRGWLLLACVFVRGAALSSPAAAGSRDANVIESFDVARNGDFILLPVAIAGKTYQFIVDTGTTGTVLDESFRETLAPSGRTIAMNGSGENAIYHTTDAFIGSSKTPIPPEAICLNLSAFRESFGVDIRGILGMSFLKHHVVRIDFDAGKLWFLRSAANSPGAMLKVGYDRNCPTINCAIGKHASVKFILDTGLVGGTGTIKTTVFDQFLDDGSAELVGKPNKFLTVYGERLCRKATLSRFQIGDFNHEQLGFGEGGITNALGLGYLARFAITFDFPGSVIYLNPGKQFAVATRFDMSGLLVACKDRMPIIREISDNSPAAGVGLRAGDRLLSIDGEALDGRSLFELHALLCVEGRRVRVVVQRADQVIVAVMILADWQGLNHRTHDKASQESEARGAVK